MLKTKSEQRVFDGTIGFYAHSSAETKTEMSFAVFIPPRARAHKVPALYYLAGLTCTEETFVIKANALRFAADHGLVLVAPDTSPRGANLAGEDESWDFGTGAGFYLDAETPLWSRHYRMYSYVTKELPALVEASFPVDPARRGIFGHSMGGHGALVIALKNPERYHSVSAFAPISNPVAVQWGEKAFGNYLGADRSRWAEWDASLLMRTRPYSGDILVDQGEADQFLTEQLCPDALAEAAAVSGQKLTLRRHVGYDHSYWFIQSFVADHFVWHATRLNSSDENV